MSHSPAALFVGAAISVALACGDAIADDPVSKQQAPSTANDAQASPQPDAKSGGKKAAAKKPATKKQAVAPKIVAAGKAGKADTAGKADKGARPARLNRKEAEVVDAVALAHAAGNQVALLELLAPFASKLNDARTAIVEAAFQERFLPSLGRMLVDARLNLIEQGLVAGMPKITPREAVFLLPAFDGYVAELIAPPKGEGPEPDLTKLEKFEEYEAILWKLHVRRNRADSARRVVEYAIVIRDMFNDKQLARLSEPDRAHFRHDAKAAREAVDKVLVDLDDRAAEARLERLIRARKVLEGTRLTGERYLAAYTWRLDAGRLREYFQGLAQTQPPRETTRPALAAVDIAATVDKLAAECEAKAGDLTQRAEWLFEGLHWWLRGRYGAGTEVFGLAKSQQALASPLALFPLMMPAETPKPTPPGSTSSVTQARPFYDRRHHYWWAWEDRGVVSSTTTQETSRSTNYQDWCKGGYFY